MIDGTVPKSSYPNEYGKKSPPSTLSTQRILYWQLCALSVLCGEFLIIIEELNVNLIDFT